MNISQPWWNKPVAGPLCPLPKVEMIIQVSSKISQLNPNEQDTLVDSSTTVMEFIHYKALYLQATKNEGIRDRGFCSRLFRVGHQSAAAKKNDLYLPWITSWWSHHRCWKWQAVDAPFAFADFWATDAAMTIHNSLKHRMFQWPGGQASLSTIGRESLSFMNPYLSPHFCDRGIW